LHSSPPTASSVSIALRAASRQLQPEPPLAQPVLTAATSTYRRWAQPARRVPPASSPSQIVARARTVVLENGATAVAASLALLVNSQTMTRATATCVWLWARTSTARTVWAALRALLALSRMHTAVAASHATRRAMPTCRPRALRAQDATLARSRMRG